MKTAALILLTVIASHTDGRVIEQRTAQPDKATCEQLAAYINTNAGSKGGPWKFRAECKESDHDK